MHEDPDSRRRHAATTGFAVQTVIRRFMNNTAMEVHLVNVQRPFSAYVAQFSSRQKPPWTITASRRRRRSPRRRQMLDKFSIPYAAHMEWATGRS